MWIKLVVVLLGVMLGWYLLDDFNAESLQGKRVIVTGASTGIGEQMAYHFCRLGAQVLVTSRREAALKKVVDNCREVGDPDGKYYYYAADMSDLTSTEKVIQEAVDRMGGLDYLVLNHILVHNLGGWEGSPENLTRLNTIMDVNFKAYVHLATHAMPHLDKTEGRVIVVSSVAGKLGQPFVAAYSASKFALDGFFSSLRQELILKGSKVSVTLGVIGLIGTENAVNKLLLFGKKFLLETLKPALPADAALAIIKGGANRQWEMYFPYLETRLITLIRDWMPKPLAAINRYLYS
ncbi:hydroxysteroid 11-beta-dehydrogenase 1-like protein [Liolophura sinensis]|uniref:hydroxysteroid 11-beta-dehydrogenase 1-like protein n=1 Tax=Liolophura sinensis TaxID=3198878 RepID=UPI00315844AF